MTAKDYRMQRTPADQRLDQVLRTAFPPAPMADKALIGRIAAGARYRAMRLGPEELDLGAAVRRLLGLGHVRTLAPRLATLVLALGIGIGIGSAGFSPIGSSDTGASEYEGLFSGAQSALEDQG